MAGDQQFSTQIQTLGIDARARNDWRTFQKNLEIFRIPHYLHELHSLFSAVTTKVT